MSGEEIRRLEDGLRLLTINLQRIADKYQHLTQSIRYLGDDIAIMQNNLDVVSGILNQLKDSIQKKEGKKSKKK